MPLLDEREAVEQVFHRLSYRFPDVSAETVRLAVRKAYDDLDGPLRDFVPLLVEHDARNVLASAARAVGDTAVR